MIDSLWKKMSKLYFIDFFCRNSIKKLQAHFWPDIVVYCLLRLLSLLEQDGFLSGWSFGQIWRLKTSEIRWVKWKHSSLVPEIDWEIQKKQISSIFHFHHVTISFWCYVSECFFAIQSICRGQMNFCQETEWLPLNGNLAVHPKCMKFPKHSWQSLI